MRTKQRDFLELITFRRKTIWDLLQVTLNLFLGEGFKLNTRAGRPQSMGDEISATKAYPNG